MLSNRDTLVADVQAALAQALALAEQSESASDFRTRLEQSQAKLVGTLLATSHKEGDRRKMHSKWQM